MIDVVVAGMDRGDNALVKFVTDYGFNAIHFSHTPSTPLPRARAAIVALNHCSHDLMNRVKKEYSEMNRPIFYASGGSSGIKADWEEKVVQPIRDTVSKLGKQEALLFLMALFHKTGTKIHTGEFLNKVTHYISISQPYLATLVSKWTDSGMLTKMEGKGSKGRYIFNGLLPDMAATIAKEASTHIPEKWILKPREEKKVVEIKTVPTSEVPPTAAPAPVDMAPKVSASEEWEKKMEARLESFMASVTHKMTGLARQVDIMAHSFNPQTRESMIRSITEALYKMPADELLKIKSMFDLWTKK